MSVRHAKSGEVIQLPLGKDLATTRTVTLAKTNELEVIRLVIPAGKEIPLHSVPGEITVQCLEGRVLFMARKKCQALAAGEFLYLSGGEPHSLQGIENSSLLVTILASKEPCYEEFDVVQEASEESFPASDSPGMVVLRPTPELTSDEREALRSLSLAVYPPEPSAPPGGGFEWVDNQWSVIVWDDASLPQASAHAHAGIVIRQARWKDRPVTIGGIGKVMTHPERRGLGLASRAVNRSMKFFGEQGNIDFALLVCKPELIPFYDRLGWRLFPGALFVAQHGETMRFTSYSPMTQPIGVSRELDGVIDLLGPPW